MAYHLLYISLKLLSYIPFRLLYILSDGLGFILYHIVRYRRAIVRRNLTESFPQKDRAEIKRIEKEFYRFFTDNALETIKLASISPAEIGRRMRFTNIDEINDVLRSGRSISLFVGHFGNWEWMSSMPLYLDKCAVPGQIYHKLSNKNFDRLMLKIRARMGAINIEMRQTARFITKQIRENRQCIIGFIADQSPRARDAHYFIPFLNHETPILLGPEKITTHYNFEAWFMKTSRTRRGFYEVQFIRLTDEPGQLKEHELSDMYYSHLEAMIIENPQLYLWSHKRFRLARCIVPPKN